jgi:hypothetical protein
MIDVIFSPALLCGIEGTSCQGLAQGGLIVEDRRRLDGGIWLRPVCIGCLPSITAEMRHVPVHNPEIQPAFQTLMLTTPLPCPGAEVYRTRFGPRSESHQRSSTLSSCSVVANIAVVYPIGEGLWACCIVCPFCAGELNISLPTTSKV